VLFLLASGLMLVFGMLGVLNVTGAMGPMLLQQFVGESCVLTAERQVRSSGLFKRRTRRARPTA
jgi:hypothetical protein